MSDLQDKIRQMQFQLFMNWMLENYLWYEVITTGLMIVSTIGFITSIICMIWVSSWWWKVGLTSVLLFFLTKLVYKNLLPSFYEQYESRK